MIFKGMEWKSKEVWLTILASRYFKEKKKIIVPLKNYLKVQLV